MTTDITNFDASKVTVRDPKELKANWGSCKYFPILYDGKKLKVITPKCFCLGLRKDTFNSNSYRLPLVMANKGSIITEEHAKFVSVFKSIVSSIHNVMNIKQDGVTPRTIGKCLHTTKGESTPILYSKVRYNKERKKFITNF